MAKLPHLGVGLGYREPMRRDILSNLGEVDFLEVVTDAFFRNPKALQALSSLKTCIPHSLNCSVGSETDPEYLDKVANLVEMVSPPWHSDHLAFTRAGEVSSGHLAPVPYTDEALDVVVQNVKRIQERIPVPFALENITMVFYWPHDTIPEHEFLSEVVRRTGCHLLLDLENVRVNTANHGRYGRGGREFLDALPLDQVAQVHIAGGQHHMGLEHDTHAAPVPDATWSLLEYLCEHVTPPGVLLERDASIPAFSETLGELRRAQSIVKRVIA